MVPRWFAICRREMGVSAGATPAAFPLGVLREPTCVSFAVAHRLAKATASEGWREEAPHVSRALFLWHVKLSCAAGRHVQNELRVDLTVLVNDELVVKLQSGRRRRVRRAFGLTSNCHAGMKSPRRKLERRTFLDQPMHTTEDDSAHENE